MKLVYSIEKIKCYIFWRGRRKETQYPASAQHYDDSRFSILAKGRPRFHLLALEKFAKKIRVQLED